MSDKPEKPTTNGVAQDPLKRLASIRPPRDLSLGGAKPVKKVFIPNLNVTRNKTKGPTPNLSNLRDVKNNVKGKPERRNNDRNRNFKNGPNIIKSAGIFSEGLATAEKQSRSSYYSRGDSEPSPALQKPTIRVKDVIKIDKELEDQRIRSAVDLQGNTELESEDFKHGQDVDAPVKLPMDDGGWAHSQMKVPLKIKQEVIVKQEPADDVDCPISVPVVEESQPDVKDVFEDTNVVNLLRSEKPTLILLQLPDTLPGRGGGGDDEPQRRKPAGHNEPSTSSASDEQEKQTDNRCRLTDLEEGRIGKLLVRRSGRVTFVIGDTMFEVCTGTKAAFHQEVVSMAVDETSRSANLIALGSLQHKLNVTPDWESMFSNMTV